MADNSKLRSSRAVARAAEPADEAAMEVTPLAELARLIGKNDPYAEFGLREPTSEQPEETDPTAE